MAIPTFSAVFWKKHFGAELEDILELFSDDDAFAEVCQDFIQLDALNTENLAVDAHLNESLSGLKNEIEHRLRQKAMLNHESLNSSDPHQSETS